MAYPEHEKLKKIAEKSQACGELMEWLQFEKHWLVCRRATDEEREAVDTNGFSEWDGQEFTPARYSLQDLLAEFFGIDRKKLEEEKDLMLKDIKQS